MNKIICLLLLVIPGIGFSQDYAFETDKATVAFEYLDKGTKGTIEGATGKMNIYLSDLSKSTISGSADVNKLSTGVNMRDKHLKSDDFFDVKEFPTMDFACTKIIKDPENEGAYLATGNLTIKGVTKEVEFKMTSKSGSLIFYTQIYSADFGVSLKKDRARSKVNIDVTVPII